MPLLPLAVIKLLVPRVRPPVRNRLFDPAKVTRPVWVVAVPRVRLLARYWSAPRVTNVPVATSSAPPPRALLPTPAGAPSWIVPPLIATVVLRPEVTLTTAVPAVIEKFPCTPKPELMIAAPPVSMKLPATPELALTLVVPPVLKTLPLPVPEEALTHRLPAVTVVPPV